MPVLALEGGNVNGEAPRPNGGRRATWHSGLMFLDLPLID